MRSIRTIRFLAIAISHATSVNIGWKATSANASAMDCLPRVLHRGRAPGRAPMAVSHSRSTAAALLMVPCFTRIARRQVWQPVFDQFRIGDGTPRFEQLMFGEWVLIAATPSEIFRPWTNSAMPCSTSRGCPVATRPPREPHRRPHLRRPTPARTMTRKQPSRAGAEGLSRARVRARRVAVTPVALLVAGELAGCGGIANPYQTGQHRHEEHLHADGCRACRYRRSHPGAQRKRPRP